MKTIYIKAKKPKYYGLQGFEYEYFDYRLPYGEPIVKGNALYSKKPGSKAVVGEFRASDYESIELASRSEYLDWLGPSDLDTPEPPEIRVIENHKPTGPDNEEISTGLSSDDMFALAIVACVVALIFGVIVGASA